jgi:acyl homoserine lactone synthase
MFQDRADQFHTRLGWQVKVDDAGFERDEYDAMNPLYVIWQRPDGRHGGSMRFMPTTGHCMVNDHFGHLTGAKPVNDAEVWECTRFCLARDAAPRTAAALMLGGAELGLRFGLRQSIGVFDARMVRIYGRLGWPPTVIGHAGLGRDAISAGLWDHAPAVRDRMAQQAGISTAISALWCLRAFGAQDQSQRSA